MQENINIPDSTITTNLSFRNLVLMNMQQLTNFPYIEKDFDALTDYELLCLVVKYLNDVIANQNEQNDSITRMYQSFLALQDYVNTTKDDVEDAFNKLDDYVRNYFDNLDVQEEINNKLDSMVEDGVLYNIINQYLPYIYVESYGAVGNGETDDTQAFEDALSYAGSVKGTIRLLNKTYLIGNITIPSYVNIIGGGFKNSILKAKENITGNLISITQMNDNYITLRDFQIIGNKNNTLTSGIYIDKGSDYANSADSFITVENLLISNIYGDGIYNGPGGRENRFKNIIVEYCGGHGINSQSSDCYFEGITCKYNTKNGLHIQSGACRFINIKCFLNGYNNNSNSREDIAGFWIGGTNNLFSTCDAQENYGDGFYIKNSYNSFSNCLADANGFKVQRYNDDGTYADMNDSELLYDGFHIVDNPVVKNTYINAITSDHRRSSNHQLQRYGLFMGNVQNSTIILNGYNNIKPLYYASGFQVNINFYANNYVEVNGNIVGSAISNRLTLNNVDDVKNALDIFIDNDNVKKLRFTNNGTNTMQVDNMSGNTYIDTPLSVMASENNDGTIFVGDNNKHYNLNLRGKGIGFFGHSPVAQQTTVANATDLNSCIYLANQLKAKLQNLGLIAED